MPTLRLFQTLTATLSVVFISILLISCGDKDAVDVSLSTPYTLSDQVNTPQSRVYTFGFDPRSSPQEDARQYLPFLKYLEKSTGYRFQLRFTHKGDDIVDDIGKGELDFAAIGATSYIHARTVHNYAISPVVRGVNIQGKDKYRSYFVVRPDSDIQHLSQIPGHRFAFGSENSTQGHLIPRIVMQQHGISLAQLSNYQYTGSHINCANTVVAGLADICAMQDTMAEDMAEQGLLRILYQSDYYPSSGIAASTRVDKQVTDKVRLALISFRPQGKHSATLYNWHKTEMPKGFVSAKDEDYQALQQWMLKLGFIKPEAGS